MKILIIGNGNLCARGNRFFINRDSGKFCEDLSDSGFFVNYLQFSKNETDNDNLLSYMLREDIGVLFVKARSGFLKLFGYIEILAVYLINFWRYDLIYIYYPGHFSKVAAAVCYLLRKKYALYIRGESNLNSWFEKRIVSRANFILTVSGSFKNQVAPINEDVEVISPMIHFKKDQILDFRHYSQDGKIRCLYVGRVEPRKGTPELIKAIRHLRNIDKDISFDVVGGGVLFESINSLFEDDNEVRFHGLIKDPDKLIEIYRKADMFIFPSHDEGFPRVLYEAMMARVPIVTTLVGGISDLMEDDVNCLRIDVDSVEDIVRKVLELKSNPALRGRLAD